MNKKMINLLNKLENELIYVNGAFDHIKSHCSYNKNEPILSASTLKADLDVAVNLINKIIEEKNNKKQKISIKIKTS